MLRPICRAGACQTTSTSAPPLAKPRRRGSIRSRCALPDRPRPHKNPAAYGSTNPAAQDVSSLWSETCCLAVPSVADAPSAGVWQLTSLRSPVAHCFCVVGFSEPNALRPRPLPDPLSRALVEAPVALCFSKAPTALDFVIPRTRSRSGLWGHQIVSGGCLGG